MDKSFADLIVTRKGGDAAEHLTHIIKQAGRYLIENASALASDGVIPMHKGIDITISVKADDDFVTIKKESELFLVDMGEK